MKIGYVLFVTAVVYRIVVGILAPKYQFLLDFTPIAALALCGPMIFKKKTVLILPLSILLVSDIALNAYYGVALVSTYMLPRCLALVLIAVLGFSLRDHREARTLLTATITASCSFYLMTNSAAWLVDPNYAKTLAGWFQALTTGLPGYPPTWLFFRNALLRDLFFSTAFLLCMALTHDSKRRGVTNSLEAKCSL